jgi:hypothetical protein
MPLAGEIYGIELLIVLYVSPILGPITRTTAITRTATRERMKVVASFLNKT